MKSNLFQSPAKKLHQIPQTILLQPHLHLLQHCLTNTLLQRSATIAEIKVITQLPYFSFTSTYSNVDVSMDFAKLSNCYPPEITIGLICLITKPGSKQFE